MSVGFVTVRAVGGVLPPDLLSRVIAGDRELGGLAGSEFHLAGGETPRAAANRAWSYLVGVWESFRIARERLPVGDAAVGVTRERWLLLLLRELGYGRIPTTPAGGLRAAERSFPVSHQWGRVPIHLLGWGVDLDKRTKGVPGAAERAPHAMMQELLNRSDDCLWGIVSNGRILRLLRDSTSLSGQSFVEFDLEAMFDGEVFSDFALMFFLLHQSRVEVLSPDGPPSDCWLERWRTTSIESGTRALGLLREGVRQAIEALGTGFLQSPGADLHRRLADGELRLEDFHRSLLRLVYRLLFLFVAEDRGALLSPDADPVAAGRYQQFFSTPRLRRLSLRRHGTKHIDLWEVLSLVVDALGRPGGRPELGLPGIGGLFEHGPLDVVTGQPLTNDKLVQAIRHLHVVYPKGQPPRTVDYRNLGAEELGGIYESLLELVPRFDQVDRTFALETLAGNQRKTSGSYYTPTALIDLVLDEALDPLLDDAEKSEDAEAALLGLTVCDPACGSGHFLVAAARRIADRLAVVRTGDIDPTPTDLQAAMHDVVSRCIYGVDINPMAAELAKVSLWLEALQPGRPLTFLDVHIKVGNALLGTTPALLAAGIPDGAFDPIEGDDKKYAATLKRINRHQRSNQGELFDVTTTVSNRELQTMLDKALPEPPKSLEDLQVAQQRYRDYQQSEEFLAAKRRADAWCTAFVQPKLPGTAAITQGALDTLSKQQVELIERLTNQYRFFHWHLEFPHIFDVPDHGAGTPTGWTGGFNAMIGNPPFLNQLESATAVDAGSRRMLDARLGRVLRAYTDVSAIFLACAIQWLQPRGRVSLVQPQSLLATRDAGPVRQYLAKVATLRNLWLADEHLFDASVFVCVPALERGGPRIATMKRHGPGFEMMPPLEVDMNQLATAQSWSPLVDAGYTNVGPMISLSRPRLSDIASATADFRDQYYGLIPFVEEPDVAVDATAWPKLLTTGLVDPAHSLWGVVSTRFGKQSWAAPRINLNRLKAESHLGDWADSRLVPKVLMATQTKVIEAYADAAGEYLPSVPLITVRPNSDADLWLILAAVLSPTASRWAYVTFRGAGMTADAIKLSASQVRDIPLPDKGDLWSRAADVVVDAQNAPDPEDKRHLLTEMAILMCSAYGDHEETLRWWLERLPLRRS